MKLSDLHANPKNPRKITDAKLKMLKASLEEFGDLSGIVFNRRTKRLVGGHMRVKSLPPDSLIKITSKLKRPSKQGTVALGTITVDGEEYAYREVDFDEQREKAANISANKGAGDWDLEQLGEWFKELDDGLFDLDLTMFDETERLDFLKPDAPELEPEEDEEEPEDEPLPVNVPERVKLGQTWQLGRHTLYCGDNVKLKELPASSVESVVTDPPAGISFMGKDWDGDKGGRDAWVKWLGGVMGECLRVLKPGGHALVWSLPRTSHWTALALEDAGFEIRDCIVHLFGSGFPKSLDVSKAIDKAAGAERPVVGLKKNDQPSKTPSGWGFTEDNGMGRRDTPITIPATAAAAAWEGWGTALKPSFEGWWLVRKPCSEKTVAANVLKWGTGAINIDGCRIQLDAAAAAAAAAGMMQHSRTSPDGHTVTMNVPGHSQPMYGQGRFPANLVLDEQAAAMLDEQSGPCKTGDIDPNGDRKLRKGVIFTSGTAPNAIFKRDEATGVSRFFYVAKASKSDRGDGNVHATVKPLRLMQYFTRMLTPPASTVLEPFAGSGTTLIACEREGFACQAFELDPKHCDIILARWEQATGQTAKLVKTAPVTKRKNAV